jgi:exopolysaccharide biosynthesis protein
MHKFFAILFIAIPVFCGTGCSYSYDDSALWKDVDKIWSDLDSLQKRINDINTQADMLSQIVNGAVITSIVQNEEGDYVVTYKDNSNVEQTVVIATDRDIVQVPVIGVKLDGGVYYWTSTTGSTTSWILDGGEKIPLGGKTPVIGIDEQGYWTVNGARIKDSNGNNVKAERKSVSLILDIQKNGDDNAVITLGNGTQITAQLFDAFNLSFEINAQALTNAKYLVTDPTQPITVDYTITGKNAADARVDIVKCTNLSASLNTTDQQITVTFSAGFEEGILMVTIFDLKENMIIKPILFSTTLNQEAGISTADDLVAFALAVNEGRSIARFRDASGAVVLNNDIDMSGITSWTPIGKVIPSTISPNTAVTYTPENAFDGVFDGKGFSIKNIQWNFDVSDGHTAYGLFGAIDGATVKNLILGTAIDNSSITLTGTASQGITIGAIAGYATSSTITNVRNYVDLAFTGNDDVNTLVSVGGIAGTIDGSTIGGATTANSVTNDGEITCGTIVNTGNGANGGMLVSGICAVMDSNTANLLQNCINNGDISAPSGRGGGLVAVGTAGTVTYSVNNGKIQDDINGIFASHTTPYDRKRMGGLVGGTTSANFTLSYCTNNGSVFSQLGCRTGGFVGHNASPIINCTNNGIILSDFITVGTNKHGAGWACGYNDNASRIKDCTMGGKVGDYTLYNTAPQTAPDATFGRAVCHGPFSPADNGLTDDMDAYYEWTTATESQLHTGVKYYKYAFTNISQNIYVLEIDMTNPNVEITTVVSNDLIPNPNGNDDANNGKNLRETLSETCIRKRGAGENILAGVNTGYFDSNNGIPRGFHIQDGEAYYINNPDARSQLTNHRWGFSVFEDKTVSFDTRAFKGLLQVDGVGYEYYSINDTITRLTATTSYDANLYTQLLQKTPHVSRPDLTNTIGTNALFIVGTNDSPMLVNKGFVNATITGIIDGRQGGISEAPYVSADNQWVLQVTGAKATALAATLTTGKSVKIRSDVYLNSNTSTPAIVIHNSSMYRFLQNGGWNNPNVSSNPNSSNVNDPYPATVAGTSQDGKTVYLVAVEGKTGSNATGLSYYELYRVGKKLGCHNMVRFDGGGSTSMWVYENGTGSIVNTVADSNGERSCLNYLHVRIK